MDSQRFAKLISAYEAAHPELIRKFTYDGIALWPHLKISLYFGLIRENESGRQGKRWSLKSSFFYRLFRISVAAVDFAFLLFRVRFRRERIFYLANTVDKVKIDDEGLFTNQIIDGFVQSNKLRKYIYAEASYKGQWRRPSTIDTDIRVDRYNHVMPILLASFRNKARIEQLSEEIRKSLVTFFKDEEILESLKGYSIQNVLLEFMGEYYFYYVLLKSAKPKLIITSEYTGRPVLMAARKLGIRSLDLQHGVIDKFHPQYIFDSSLRSIKYSMGLPSFVGVFGEIHKKVMLENNFWDDEEIAVLGNYRIENMRNQYSKEAGIQAGKEHWILIPTQWNIFRDFENLLNGLAENLPVQFRILLKMHPLELNEHLTLYEEIAGRSKGRIVIAGKNQNTYSLITGADIIIGFDSAVLLEAVALGKPVISISTQSLPSGILGYYDDPRLSNAVKTVDIRNINELTLLIGKALNDSSFYENWIVACKEEGNYLFADNYTENCKDFVDANWN